MILRKSGWKNIYDERSVRGMKHYLLYAHGGAYNHGSEVSVKCDIALL